MNFPKNFAKITLAVLIVTLLGAAGYFSFSKRLREVPEQTNIAATPVPMSVQEWRVLTDRIRALKTVQENGTWVSPPEKEALIEQYGEISDGSLSIAILDTLPEETDHDLFYSHIAVLQHIIDARGIQHLFNLINATPESSARHELFLRVLHDVHSPDALPALREVVRNKGADSHSYIVVEAMLALVQSGKEDDIRAVFDRINLETKDRSFEAWIYSQDAEETEEPVWDDPRDEQIRQQLSFLGDTRSVSLFDIANPEALPFLLDVSSGKNTKNTKAARVVAVYCLREFRNDPKASRLLNDLTRNADKDIASAAMEALGTVK